MNHETMASRIHRKLEAAFAPVALEVVDFSNQHAGHAGSRPSGETHFNVKIASAAFKGMNKVATHRAIYAALSDEMNDKRGIHALTLDVSAE